MDYLVYFNEQIVTDRNNPRNGFADGTKTVNIKSLLGDNIVMRKNKASIPPPRVDHLKGFVTVSVFTPLTAPY